MTRPYYADWEISTIELFINRLRRDARMSTHTKLGGLSTKFADELQDFLSDRKGQERRRVA